MCIRDRDFVALIRKAIDPSPRKRFRDAVAMHNAMSKIRFPLSNRSIVLKGTAELGSLSTRRVA